MMHFKTPKSLSSPVSIERASGSLQRFADFYKCRNTMKRQEILLVDDNTELAENMCEILISEGFKVTFFDSPSIALESFSPDRYWIALLDLRMPEMDGVELCRRLWEREPSLPAIAITAFAEEERIQLALHEGISAVLFKPINISALLRTLTTTFYTSERQRVSQANKLSILQRPEAASTMAREISP